MVGLTHISVMSMNAIIKAAGGVTKLARALGLHHTTVMGWKEIPHWHAREVARLSGKTLNDVRPDIWDESAPGTSPEVQVQAPASAPEAA